MILNKHNEIDNKISKTFPKNVIENINIDTVDYFGINIGSNIEDDFSFKIYTQDKSRDYSKYHNISLINYLIKKNMLVFLTMVQDKNNSDDFSRCDIGLKLCENKEYEEIFEWLDKNVKFFNKYRDEIIKISKMKRDSSKKFSSLYFIGFIKEDSEIKVLKCHWYNTIKKGDSIFKNSYYLNFLKRKNIQAFNELIPYAKSAIKNCNGHLIMEGIDYNEHTPEKHKIYIKCPSINSTYAGLIKTFKENKEFVRKINLVREWNNIHNEFYCDGFAICKDTNYNLTLNLYLRLYK